MRQKSNTTFICFGDTFGLVTYR